MEDVLLNQMMQAIKWAIYWSLFHYVQDIQFTVT